MSGLLFIEPGDGQAHSQAAEHSQDMRGFWRTHPAAILVEDFIEAIVQGALDSPVVSFERFKLVGRQRFLRAAADEINRFLAFFAVATHVPAQLPDLLRSRKANALGRRLLAFQRAYFPAAAVTLPFADAGPRGGARGKKAAL
jgi:hypothetical protein